MCRRGFRKAMHRRGIVLGVKFTDGIEEVRSQAQAVAA
jgi:hypothetical protein